MVLKIRLFAPTGAGSVMKTRSEILNFRTLLTEYSDAILRHQDAIENERLIKAKYNFNTPMAGYEVTREDVLQAGVDEIRAWQDMIDAFNRLEEAFCTTGLLMVEDLNKVEFKLRGLKK
jgi:hypothetical protein